MKKKRKQDKKETSAKKFFWSKTLSDIIEPSLMHLEDTFLMRIIGTLISKSYNNISFTESKKSRPLIKNKKKSLTKNEITLVSGRKALIKNNCVYSLMDLNELVPL